MTTPAKITFTINHEIRLGSTKVGKIEYRSLQKGVRWKVKLNEVSGRPGVVGDFEKLKDAKAAAIAALTVT